MKLILLSAMCLGMALTGWAQSKSWSGTLADSACKEVDAKQACLVEEGTKAFGLQTADGKFFRFDAAGNAKALAALRTPGAKAAAKVTVTGAMDGEVIQVEAIQMQ